MRAAALLYTEGAIVPCASTAAQLIVEQSDREFTVEIGRLKSMGKVRNALNRRLNLVRGKIQQHSSTVDVDELKQKVFVELRDLNKSRAHDARRLLVHVFLRLPSLLLVHSISVVQMLSMKAMHVASERDSFGLASVHTKEVLRVLEQQLKKETFAYKEAIDVIAACTISPSASRVYSMLSACCMCSKGGSEECGWERQGTAQHRRTACASGRVRGSLS